MLRKRSISKYEVETLFRDVLNLNQIEQISNLIKLLGSYVFLERGQLDYLSKRVYGQKIGLSFIKKAVKFNLVSELQVEGDSHNKFYFQLKNGGFYFLDTLRFRYRKFKLDAGAREREKILSINHFLIDNKYLLDNNRNIFLYEPLVTTSNTILYNNLSKAKAIDITRKEIIEKFSAGKYSYEKIILFNHKINTNLKGNKESKI